MCLILQCDICVTFRNKGQMRSGLFVPNNNFYSTSNLSWVPQGWNPPPVPIRFGINSAHETLTPTPPTHTARTLCTAIATTKSWVRYGCKLLPSRPTCSKPNNSLAPTVIEFKCFLTSSLELRKHFLIMQNLT